MVTTGDDSTLFVFTVTAGVMAIYNSLETIMLIFSVFSIYKSLYFWSLMGCAIGIFLFAVGFMDLFFELYVPSGTKWRPLFVLTVGWYGMVTGFSLVMYSRLALIRVPPKTIKAVEYFILYNIIFSHFPTTVLTFGANLVGTNPWVEGYAIMEKIQMTFFAVQEVALGLIYLKYIGKSTMNAEIGSRLVKRTSKVNIFVLFLDIIMLVLEYVGLYSYQIMLKVFIYSVKLKLEFYILNILTSALLPKNGMVIISGGSGGSVKIKARALKSADGVLCSPSGESRESIESEL